jgi:hypothetical protein
MKPKTVMTQAKRMNSSEYRVGIDASTSMSIIFDCCGIVCLVVFFRRQEVQLELSNVSASRFLLGNCFRLFIQFSKPTMQNH